MGVVAAELSVTEEVLEAYRRLVPAEARLAEGLPRGVRIGATVAAQWPVIHDYLHLYGRGLARAGLLVLAGAPDTGSRHTGIPFTGPREARELLDLDVPGYATSPAAARFWTAIDGLPLEALFGVVHLAHANPFDAPGAASREAARDHIAALLSILRPQGVVALGPDALCLLGETLGNRDLVALSESSERAWAERWPPGTPLLRHPVAEVISHPPFRVRVAPMPALEGPDGAATAEGLARLFGWLVG